MRFYDIAKSAAVLLLLVSTTIIASPAPVLAQAELFGRILGIAIDNARQKQLEEQGGATVDGARPAAPVSRSETLEVQRRLNALGYSAGVPDGVMGNSTRRAIAAWQADQGRAATGSLGADEVAALLSSSPSVADGAPALDYDGEPAGGELSLLYDTDLPENDYRSGMKDPALKGGELSDCVNLCAADGRCQAFTYNARARVCFLKDAAASPIRFKGAISGIKSGSSFAPVEAEPAASDSRLLRADEIVELQQALAAGGYDLGKPDGRLGKKTRAAIASFLEDHPGAGSGRVDVALLLAVTGSTTPRPSFDASLYQPLGAVVRPLALIAVAHDQTLIASDDAVRRWLAYDVENGFGADAKAVADRFDNANVIEQPAILAGYRAGLIAEATAFAADPASRSIKVRAFDDTELGRFSAETGMPIVEPYSGMFAEHRLSVGIDFLEANFAGIVPGLPDSYSVPLADDKAASAFLDLVGAKSDDGKVKLAAYLTISNFGTDANIEGAGAGGIPFTVKLDRLALLTVAGYNNPKMPGEEQLALLVDAFEPEGGTPADALAIARSIGLPVLADHIAFAADSDSARILGTPETWRYDEQLKRFFSFATLSLYPGVAKDGFDNATVIDLMTPTQRLRVFGDREGTAGGLANEFERRRAQATFSEQIVPELVSRAPAFPIPIVSLKLVSLGEYDFASQSFPLAYDTSPLAVRVPYGFETMAPGETWAGLPKTLPIEEKAAEKLLAAARRNGRPTYLFATFGRLVAEPGAEGRFDVHFVADSAGLFSDFNLQNKLLEIDAATLLARFDPNGSAPRQISIAGSDQPWVPRYRVPVLDDRPLFVKSDMPGAEGLRAVGMLFALKADPSLFERPDMTMRIGGLLNLGLADYLTEDGRKELQNGYTPSEDRYWRGADEFEREDTRQRFIAERRDQLAGLLPSLPLEISVFRFAGVAEYNTSAGAFPLQLSERTTLTPGTSSDDIGIAVLDGADNSYPDLTMSEAAARAFRDRLRGFTDKRLDPAVFGDTGVSLEPGSLAMIESYRITALKLDGDHVNLVAEPTTRRLATAADLSTTLLDLPYPGAAAAAAEIAPEIAAPLAPPQSRFDLLGVKLGMSVDAAKQVLEQRLAGRNFVPLVPYVPDYSPSTACRVVQDQMDRELSGVTDTAAQQKIRDAYLDDLLAGDCPAPDAVVLDFAFGYDVAQDGGTEERIIVFKAPQSGDVVGAIARQVPDEMKEAFGAGLVDKYGSNIVSDGYLPESRRYWVDQPEMASHFNDSHTNDACTPVWPELNQLPSAYLTTDCGAFVWQLHDQVLLIDTRYTSAEARLIGARVQAAAAIKPKPALDF